MSVQRIKYINLLSKYRTELMGIAILLVLLYHIHCCSFGSHSYDIFKHGYIGVDIFMLVSGLGLCYSYNKNSIGGFYKNRLLRIYPFYFVQVLINNIFFPINGHFSITDFLLELTTVSYWGFVLGNSNWYIAAILYLYTLFPILYKVGEKKPNLLFVITCLFSFFLLSVKDWPWYIDCFFSRIPVFIIGIIIYVYSKRNVNISASVICLIIMLNVALGYNIPKEYIATLLCPFLVLLILYVRHCFLRNDYVHRLLVFLGSYSLEIYLSDMYTGKLFHFIRFHRDYTLSTIEILVLYFVSTVILSGLFILITRPLRKGIQYLK